MAAVRAARVAALTIYVITARWTEMGALLLLNGGIPLPFLIASTSRTVTSSHSRPGGSIRACLSTNGFVDAAALPLAAALICTVPGATLLTVTAIRNRRNRRRPGQIAARR
jgi:hypothetical protein